MGIIELHSDVRAVIAEGAFAMLLITGTDKVRCGYGNGDSLLVDLDHRVFAIADATERFPHASRVLLSNVVNGLHTIPQSNEEWSHYLNGIYARQEYHMKSTLSLIALQERENITQVFIAHGGDSSLKIYDRHTKREQYSTKVNMNFAGRSKTLQKVESVNLYGQSRVVICSDGFNDVIKHCGIQIEDLITVSFMEMITHIVDKVVKLEHKEYDDISLLLIDIPTIYTVHSKGILMGGTTRLQEQNIKESMCIHDYNSLIKYM